MLRLIQISMISQPHFVFPFSVFKGIGTIFHRIAECIFLPCLGSSRGANSTDRQIGRRYAQNTDRTGFVIITV